MNSAIIGDKDFIESYWKALKEPLVITRAAWPGMQGATSVVELGTSYPPTANRGDVARDLGPRINEIAASASPEILLVEMGSIEYTVLGPALATLWRPRLVLVEVSRLHPASIAALKELSLLSNRTTIVGIYQRMAPRSRKLRPLFLDASLRSAGTPGFFSFRLKRLKSYMRAWLWYYEARDTVGEARKGGVPDYLLIDLEGKLAEAERLLRGSEFTIVYPSIYDIKEPPPDELYKSAPLLMPAETHKLYSSTCYASIDLARGGLISSCREREDLSEEAIYLWLVKLDPLPVWRGALPGHLAETYASYNREVREAPYRLHAWQPGKILPGVSAPWHVIPLYSHDEDGLRVTARTLLEDLRNLKILASVAAECVDEARCTAAVESAGPVVARAVRDVLDRLEEYRSLVSLYKSVARLLGGEARLLEKSVTREELQENIALLAWILQATLGLDPEYADLLSLNAGEIAELVL